MSVTLYLKCSFSVLLPVARNQLMMAGRPKTVLITGCSTGIGFSVALLLAQDEEKRFKVYATMRNLEKKASLETEGKEVLEKTLLVRQLDVCSDESVDKIVQEILKNDGRIDVLINNAGIGQFGILETLTMEQMKSVFDTNFFGMVRVTKAVLPNMKANESGRIVNISSIAAFDPLPFNEIYSASKFAMEGFTEALAAMLIEFNIKFVLIEPGPAETNFSSNVQRALEDMADTADEKSMKLFQTFIDSFLPANVVPTRWHQPVSEVAQIVKDTVLAKNPHFRYQTTEAFKSEARKKFTDPIENSNVVKINDRFFKWETKM